MPTYKNVHKWNESTTVPHQLLKVMAFDWELKELDFRVCLLLLTQLSGYTPKRGKSDEENSTMNFASIDCAQIAETLDVEEKKVSKSIKRLVKHGYLEKGSNDTCKVAYRFRY
jgi:predicted transcriptional regulator